MDALLWAAWVLAVSALAYWLGWKAGRDRTAAAVGTLLRDRYGLRDLDFDTRTLTFRDGSTHTEIAP